MELEGIMLSEISQKKKYKYYTLKHNREKPVNKWYKYSENKLLDNENKLVWLPEGKREEGGLVG